MSFLNSIMLFGTAAVAVPIIIHLLNRRKFKKVTWAAMKFIKLSVEQNQRRMQLEDLILLLLRCALLALLAFALAPISVAQAQSTVGVEQKDAERQLKQIEQQRRAGAASGLLAPGADKISYADVLN